MARLRKDFPDIFFERMMFVPDLEPVPRDWDTEVIGYVCHVAKQYEVMKKHAVHLSDAIRQLVTNAARSKVRIENNERARSKMEKELEDA